MMVLEILDKEEDIIAKILAKTDMSPEQLEEEMQKKQEEYGGLLTRAGAAYSIAKELGVDLEVKQEEVKTTPISELDGTISRVSVRGIVKKAFPARRWEKEGKEGKIGSIILSENSNDIRIVFWNDHCDLLDKIGEGDEIEFRNLVVRKRDSGVELSYGKASQLIFKNKARKDYAETPKIRYVKLADLKEGQKDVSFFARVVRVFPTKEFEVKGRKGKVASVVVSDGNEIRLVLWDKQAEWSSKLRPDDVIRVEHAYVRENSGKLEVNLGRKGSISINPENAPELPSIDGFRVETNTSTSQRVKIKDLKAGDKYREIKAVIVQVYEPFLLEICPKCGERVVGKCPKCNAKSTFVLIVNCELDDGTGVIRGVFYRNLAERLLGMKGNEIKANGYDTNKILGIEKIFRGQVKENERFNRVEFIVREIADVDLNEELKLLQGV